MALRTESKKICCVNFWRVPASKQNTSEHQTMVDRRQPDTRKQHTQTCRCAVINLQISSSTRTYEPCRVGSVDSVSASRTVGREFASRPGHTKDHHKNDTNCLPA